MIKMRYKGFDFCINPRNLKITMQKRIVKTVFPYLYEKCEDYSTNAAIVTGSGSFVGDDAIVNAKNLASAYKSKGSDYLFTPYSNPLKVYFSKLNISYSSDSGRVDYDFEFIEDPQLKNEVFDFGYTFVQSGENLFDVANRCGVDVSQVVSVNDIGDVFAVREGDKIWLV